jgi:UDP-N-acetylmuramoyl-tripeptide--D-alanyl-D-alanine ligase
VRDWSPEQVARSAGATVVAGRGPAGGPSRAVIDSRGVEPGDLFFGLPGEHGHGGEFAGAALAAGAWGVLTTHEHAEAAADQGSGAVLAADDPLAALQWLAREWRRALGAQVVGITGSTGKTSTKDILGALLGATRRTSASPENYNTDVGVPLAILGAPAGTEVLVLELAMRGPGQIAELVAIAEPDVGVIVNVGPVHVELLGSLEAIAAAKAELLAGLEPGGRSVVPAGAQLLAPHLRDDVDTLTFGKGGDVSLVDAPPGRAVVDACGERYDIEISFSQAHNLENLLAAVAAARAVGIAPPPRLDVTFSALRGDRVRTLGGVLVIDDCYNANPMSMAAALRDLAATAHGRRVAVLGDMLELGRNAPRFHAEIGEQAQAQGVDVLVTVGPLAAEMAAAFAGETHSVDDAAAAAALLPALAREGDTVLVKGSRGVGLEVVAQALLAQPAAGGAR